MIFDHADATIDTSGPALLSGCDERMLSLLLLLLYLYICNQIRNSLLWRISRQMCLCSFFSFFFFCTKSSVFTKLSQANTAHLVCFCIKLRRQPGLIVSRPGRFHFIFHFLTQSHSIQPKADNEKRHDVTWTENTAPKSLTNFPGSLLFPL